MLGVVDMYICKSTKYSEFEEDLIKVSTYHLCKSIEENKHFNKRDYISNLSKLIGRPESTIKRKMKKYEFIYKKMRSNAI